MKDSTGPHYILNHLRDPILADLTQHWRQELIISELTTLQQATEDAALQQLIVNWLSKLARAITNQA